MSLPAPDLDDRRFQELVDEAKRMVQQRCPEWTDHNVSDPGVTLIELFAWMTEQVIYRLNRVPDRSYVKFLDLLGVELFPATAARAPVTFRLSAAQEETVTVPAGVDLATTADTVEDEVAFTTTEPLPILPCSLRHLAIRADDGEANDHSDVLAGGEPFHAFQDPPEPGDELLFGLSQAVPSCAVTIRVDCEIEGVGVDPDDPPLVWEAWNGDGWVRCDVEADTTGGLNREGEVLVHVIADHEASIIADRRAGWLRCRALAAAEGQPPYSTSPRILGASAFTIGGTTTAVNAAVVRDELLGVSEGVPGQSFELDHRPVVPGERPLVVEVTDDTGDEPVTERWEQVRDFSESTAEDRHFALDAVAGRVRFGPAVREPDGTIRRYGAVPPADALVHVSEYRAGGGRRGNVSADTIRVLRTSLPLVAGVTNRHAASGGVDTESLDNAKVRGPMLLQTRNRAVTTDDFEVLAREAAPEVARVRCVPAGTDESGGGVRVLIVPHAGAAGAELRFEDLVPADATLQRIAEFLDERRPVGARVVVEPPAYQGVTVVARIRCHHRASAERVSERAQQALYTYFNPLRGGPDGGGWPFGRPVHVGEVYATLQGLAGTELVEEARVFAADPITGERGEVAERIEIGPNALVFPYGHRVRVEEA